MLLEIPGVCDEGPAMAVLSNAISTQTKPVMDKKGPVPGSYAVEFSNLKVVTSTTRCIFINFQMDSAIFSWNSMNSFAGRNFSAQESGVFDDSFPRYRNRLATSCLILTLNGGQCCQSGLFACQSSS